MISSFLYGLLASFFIAAFLIKYRNEYLFIFPVLAALFAYYLFIALGESSLAQTPEKLHKDIGLILIVSFTIILMIILTVVDIPLAQRLVGADQGINYWPWE